MLSYKETLAAARSIIGHTPNTTYPSRAAAAQVRSVVNELFHHLTELTRMRDRTQYREACAAPTKPGWYYATNVILYPDPRPLLVVERDVVDGRGKILVVVNGLSRDRPLEWYTWYGPVAEVKALTDGK